MESNSSQHSLLSTKLMKKSANESIVWDQVEVVDDNGVFCVPGLIFSALFLPARRSLFFLRPDGTFIFLHIAFFFFICPCLDAEIMQRYWRTDWLLEVCRHWQRCGNSLIIMSELWIVLIILFTSTMIDGPQMSAECSRLIHSCAAMLKVCTLHVLWACTYLQALHSLQIVWETISFLIIAQPPYYSEREKWKA